MGAAREDEGGEEDTGYRDIDRPRAILNNTHTHSRCAHMDRGAGMESGRLGSEASSREKCKAPAGGGSYWLLCIESERKTFPLVCLAEGQEGDSPSPQNRETNSEKARSR